MRYTRFEFKIQKGMSLKQIIIRFIILIPIIAIVFGLTISKMIVIPFMTKVNSPKSSEVRNYEEIKPKKYYAVQAGVFSSLDKAKDFGDKLRGNKLSAYINQEGESFRVLLFLDTKKDGAEKKIRDYKAMGYSCLIKQINIEFFKVPEGLKSDMRYILLNRLINNTTEVLDSCCTLLNQYESKSIDDKKFKEQMKNIWDKYSIILKEFMDTKNDDNKLSGDIYNKYEAIGAILGEICISKGDKVEYLKLEEKVIECAYYMIDIMECYNSLLNKR